MKSKIETGRSSEQGTQVAEQETPEAQANPISIKKTRNGGYERRRKEMEDAYEQLNKVQNISKTRAFNASGEAKKIKDVTDFTNILPEYELQIPTVPRENQTERKPSFFNKISSKISNVLEKLKFWERN